MKRFKVMPSLFSALFVAGMLVVTGCNPGTISGPDLDADTSLELNINASYGQGGDVHNAPANGNQGGDVHNLGGGPNNGNQGGDVHNIGGGPNNGNQGGDVHNAPANGNQGGDVHNLGGN